MSEEPKQDHISSKMVVYKAPASDAVTARREEAYKVSDGRTLTMDLYSPADLKSGARAPAVILVAGYPDSGYERVVGCKFKEMGWSRSWGQLAAGSGLIAVTYTNREPASDVHALLEYIRENAATLGVDPNRIGLLASSGNVPLALSVLMREPRDYLKCAVLCYGYMLDLEGSTAVAEAAKMFRFANPCAGRSVDDLSQEIPLFIARAGRDEFPHLNEAIDRFLAKALNRNLPITFVNHHAAPHAFDLVHDSEASREIVRQILAFLRSNLLA